MWYAMLGEDGPDGLAGRAKVREAHLARLRALADEGRLLIAGPMPAIDAPDPGEAGFAGSLVVASFESQADAEQWLAEDPYVVHGVFVRTRVHPFKKVLP